MIQSHTNNTTYTNTLAEALHFDLLQRNVCTFQISKRELSMKFYRLYINKST